MNDKIRVLGEFMNLRKAIVLLFKKKHDMKMKINDAILELRDQKAGILEQCKKDIEKLNEIDRNLDKGTRVRFLKPHENEYPENRWEYDHQVT